MHSHINKNFFYLLCIQGGNYIFPILMLPYLAKTLGITQFGALCYAQAFVQYSIIITDFGFNLSANRRVAISRDNLDELARIYSTTTVVRILLAMLSLFLTFICINYIEILSENKLIVLGAFTAVIGNSVFPLWLFQGMEKLRVLMVANLISKSASFILMLIFVDDASDAALAAACIGSNYIILASIACYIIQKEKFVKFIKPTLAEIIFTAKDGFPIFVCNIATSFYTNFNPLLLGYFYNTTVVGQFSMADKIRLAVQALMVPVTQAYYPAISHAYASDTKRAAQLLKNAAFVLIAIASASFLLIQICVPFAINLILDPHFEGAMFLLRIQVILLPIISLALVYGQLGIIASGNPKLLTKIYVGVSVSHLIYVVPLTLHYAAGGTVAAMLVTEMAASTLIICQYRKMISK